MSNSLMVVATKYKLKEGVRFREGVWKDSGRFEKVNTNIVSREFVEQRNKHDNNENYIIDEEATAEMMEQRELNIIENAKMAKREKMTTSDLVDAIVGAKATSPKKEKPAKKEVEEIDVTDTDTPNKGWTLESLQQYCRDNDIKHHHANKEVKLLELIKNA